MTAIFHTAPRNQGQIVTISYAWIDGAVFERRIDSSPEGDITYRVCRNPWSGLEKKRSAELDAWCPWSEPAPKWLVRTMIPCGAPVVY